MKYYRTYGINICSEIIIPEFAGAEVRPVEKPDVCVKHGKVPDQLENPRRTGVCYQLSKLTLLLKIEGTAKYLAEKGGAITVDICKDADDKDVACHLTNAPLTAILLQRGLLPVYGGAVEYDGHCVIIGGASGIGKSTVIHGLIKRGYKFLSDDLCAIGALDGTLIAHPGVSCRKFQEHTLRENGLEPADHQKVRNVIDKYIAPLDIENIVDHPLPIKKMLFVCSWNKEEIELLPAENENEKFHLLHNSMHRQYLLGMGCGFKQMKLTAKMLAEVPVRKVFRIQKSSMLKEILDLIEKDLLNE